jgi:hypothetical protein
MFAHRLPSPVTALAATVVCVGALAARAQPAQPGTAWSGQMRCDVVISAPGYTNRLTHTWAITGAPALVGAIAEHPATWTVSGEGTLRSTSNSGSTVAADWETEGTSTGARIGIFIRASDGQLVVLPRHAQLSARGATSGKVQILDADQKASTQPIDSVVSELSPWPRIEDRAQSTRLSGSQTMPFAARLDRLQPSDFKGTTTCTWDFVRANGGLQSVAPGGQTTVPIQTAISGTATSSSASTAASATPSLASLGLTSTPRDPHRAPASSGQGGADIPVDNAGGIAAGESCQSLLADVNQAYAALENAIDVEYAKLKNESAARIQEAEAALEAARVASAARAGSAVTLQVQQNESRVEEIELQRANLDAVARNADSEIETDRDHAVTSLTSQCSGSATNAVVSAANAYLQAANQAVAMSLAALADAAGSTKTGTAPRP